MPIFTNPTMQSHFQRMYNWAQSALQYPPSKAYHLAYNNTLKKYKHP